MSPNKETLLNVMDLIWNKRDLDAAIPYYHETMSYYGPRITVEGKANYFEMARSYMSVITDTKFTMLEMTEEDDRIGCHGKLTGKHTGAYGEIPATNNDVTINFMSFLTFKDGKITSETEIFDEFGFMLELGMEFIQKEHA